MCKLGDIVLVNIPDPDGNACDHPRPAMIFRGPDLAGTIYVIAITSTFSEPLPKFSFLLPWDENVRETTGLYKRCIIRCDWIVKFDLARVIGKMGTMLEADRDKATEYVCAFVQEREKAARPRTNSA
jgi:hypothetical protein